MNEGQITALEITDQAIKLIQSTRGGQAALTFCDQREISPSSDEDIAKALAGFIAQSKIKAVNVYGIIPRQFVILRHLSLPSKQDSEIEKMVNLQIPKMIPYPKEDVVLNHQLLSQDAAGYSKVLVVAVHHEVIERYLKIFRLAGITVSKLTLSSWCLLEWLKNQKGKLGPETNQTIMLVNIDKVSSEICFCQDGKLLFSRNINYGSKDLHPESIASFIEHINITISTYAKEKISGNIAQIVLVSSVLVTDMLKDRLELEYKVAVICADPFENVAQKKEQKFPRDFKGASLAVGIGAALHSAKKVLDLLPREESSRRENVRKKQEWVKCALLFGLVVLSLICIFAVKAIQSSTYLGQIQNEIKASQKRVETINSTTQKLEFIKERLSPHVTSIDIIRELYSLTPQQVSFSVLYLDENGGFAIQGIADEGSAVNIFQKNLVGSHFFRDVTLQYATKRKIFKGELTDFKITCTLIKKGQQP